MADTAPPGVWRGRIIYLAFMMLILLISLVPSDRPLPEVVPPPAFSEAPPLVVPMLPWPILP